MSSTGAKPGRKLRTRTGCITCRIRRVKCDEAKPHCKVCTLSRRTCDGYATGSVTGLSRPALAAAVRRLGAVGPASRLLAKPVRADDAVCFDYFRRCAVPNEGSFFASEFWGRTVLQAAHVEPAVWAAVAALGALHRRWETMPGSEFADDGMGVQFADRAAVCYGRALHLGQSIHAPRIMLALSLALAAVANIAGKWTDSQVHVQFAQKALDQLRTENPAVICADEDIQSAAEGLARIDLQSIVFSDATVPYPYHESNMPERGAAFPGMEIGSLERAVAYLLDIFGRLMVLVGRAATSEAMRPESVLEAQMSISAEVTMWEEIMMQYLRNATAANLKKNEIPLLVVKLYHTIVRMVLKAGVSGPETRWDACLAHFERAIYLSAAILKLTPPLVSSVVVSVELGVVMPLFFVSRRCRHPVLRRYAAAMIRQARRQEGRWHGMAAAAVVKMIIWVEEDGLGIETPVAIDRPMDRPEVRQKAKRVSAESLRSWLRGDASWTASTGWEGMVIVPEKNRIADMDVTGDMSAGTAWLSWIYSDKDEKGVHRSGGGAIAF